MDLNKLLFLIKKTELKRQKSILKVRFNIGGHFRLKLDSIKSSYNTRLAKQIKKYSI